MNKLNNFQLCIITFALLHNYIAFSGHDCTLYIIMVTFEHALKILLQWRATLLKSWICKRNFENDAQRVEMSKNVTVM